MAIVEYDGTRFQLINANAFTNLTVSGALTVGTTLAVTGVATLTAQPILSSLTASLPVFSDASKGLVSNTMTGTGSVMMSASPTTTGTLTAAAINASGLVAMAGAATVGTTLGVSGVTTLGTTRKWITSEASSLSWLTTATSEGGSGIAATTSTIYLRAAGTTVYEQTATGAILSGTLSVTGTSTMAAINASGNINVNSSNIVLTAATGAISAVGALTLAPASANPQIFLTDATKGSAYLQGGVNTGGTGAGDYWIFNVPTSRGLSWAVNNVSVLNAVAAGVSIPGTLGVGGAAVGFGNGYNEITIATGANGAMLYLQGTGPLNHRLYGNGSGISYDASGATAHTFYNNSVNTVTIASNGSFQSSPPATAGAINLDLYNIAGNEADHIYAMFRLANGTSIGSIRQVSTTSAVVYNTTSDYRIKDLFGSFTTAREMLSALTVHDGQFKGSEHRIPLMVAHEVQAVTPWAVTGEKDAVDDEGLPVYQQMGTGAQEALLIAGWQDHEARLAALQAEFQSYKSSHP